jgi:hypothetical protein
MAFDQRNLTACATLPQNILSGVDNGRSFIHYPEINHLAGSNYGALCRWNRLKVDSTLLVPD